MEITYTHWEDYYKDTFLPYYEKVTSQDIESMSREKFGELYISLYANARTLMRIYINNNGTFPMNNIFIIKDFFRYELLDNAQDWIDIVFYLEENYKQKPSDFYDTIYQFYVNNKYKLFEDMIERFEGFLAEND